MFGSGGFIETQNDHCECVEKETLDEHYKIILYPQPDNMEGVKYDSKFMYYFK
jgi:hypothetical protein